MSATFSFDVDHRLGLIRVTMSGLFSQQDIADFVIARTAAHDALGLPSNTHLTLVDVRGMKIQLQHAVTEFQSLLADKNFHARRLAIVAERTLARSQLMRALANRKARCFEDLSEAEDWLFEAEAAPAPLPRAIGGSIAR